MESGLHTNVDSLIFEAMERRKEAEDLYGLSDSYSDLSDYYFYKDREKSKRYAELFLEAARELITLPTK